MKNNKKPQGSVPEHDLITKNTEHQDKIEIVDVDSLEYDIDNAELYLVDKSATYTDNEDYYEGLKTSISKNGLYHPPLVYSDGKIRSGHTRHRIVVELGYKTIPVIRSTVQKPERGYDNKMALMQENQTRTGDIGRQYRQIQLTAEAYEEKYNETCPDSVIKDTICPAAQMSWNMYSQMRALYANRKGLFDRVVKSNGSGLSPGKAYDLMIIDRKKAKSAVLPHSDTLKDIVVKEDIVFAVNFVNNAMNQLFDIQALGKNQHLKLAFDNIQQNVIGGLSHEVFTNAVADSINYRKPSILTEDVIARTSKAQRIEDIEIPSINGAIEVKTSLIKDGNKIQFTTRRIKTGFHLLIAFTAEFDFIYCSYGYLDDTAWKKAYSGPSKILLDELCKADMINFAGALKRDSKTNKVHCIPVAIGSIL